MERSRNPEAGWRSHVERPQVCISEGLIKRRLYFMRFEHVCVSPSVPKSLTICYLQLLGGSCRGVWHLHPTTLNEAVDASGKRDLISLVHLQTKWLAWVLECTACDQLFFFVFNQTKTSMLAADMYIQCLQRTRTFSACSGHVRPCSGTCLPAQHERL